MGFLFAHCWLLIVAQGPTPDKLHGSQVPWRQSAEPTIEASQMGADLRVTRVFTPHVEVPNGTKHTENGKPNAFYNFSWTAKRSYRRSRHWAAARGGTICKGRWRTAESLGATGAQMNMRGASHGDGSVC